MERRDWGSGRSRAEIEDVDEVDVTSGVRIEEDDDTMGVLDPLPLPFTTLVGGLVVSPSVIFLLINSSWCGFPRTNLGWLNSQACVSAARRVTPRSVLLTLWKPYMLSWRTKEEKLLRKDRCQLRSREERE